MLERVVSGGQTGADQAAWRAAVRFGVPTSGWMPSGYLTEDGPCPELAALYGAREMLTSSDPERTFANARDSDATLWFGTMDTPGARATLTATRTLGRPCRCVLDDISRPPTVAAWLVENKVKVLNVAGNRESKAPGIGDRVERFLAEVLRRLGHVEG